ncbi:MAG: polyamine aminopropyltransferase [Candidatus Fermentithermobacillus carboniphilus]|uniref:Polyamine aminopropyltransferase n=1 Tax=Candidatus Fermentithermobacillus carboniphilus TaxID=3085328 RepID=A0AAT9LC31_9FIRM|nr:MAG: polyamine aminopropyltransferase [Candidatus Fermentithermobacillus carboniphilus]
MEVWFTEEWLPGLRISAQIKSVVYTKRTKFQELCIFDTVEFGRMLVLDNVIQTTEKDEYIYHESLVHVPLLSHPNPEKVLIIGGGDGGALRETLKHPQVKEATLVDIDGEVIEAAKTYLPSWSSSFSDKRARVLVEDGLNYVATTRDRFDVVLVDSSDPVGPSEALFRPEFYSSIAKVLRPGGVMCAQTESPIATPAVVRDIFHRISRVFPVTRLYTAPVPSYPGGWWSFTCGSLGSDPKVPMRKPEESWELKFYSPEIHERLFILNPKLKKDVGII